MKKYVMHGAIASLLLFAFYVIVLSIGNSLSHVLDQFLSFWYVIALLIAGFGIQVALYSYIHTAINMPTTAIKTEMAASSGVSASSMVACCAHHLVDILPIIGLSAFSLFLIKYQLFLMSLGVASNFAGITFMLNIIQKHKLHKENNILFRADMKQIRNIVVILSLIVLVLVFFKSI